MNFSTAHENRSKLLLGLTVAALAISGLVAPLRAQIITLTDNNAVAQVNTASSQGMFNWSVNGVNQLNQQWFWYRIGATGGESPINTISAPSITTPNARTLYTRYNNGSYGVEVDYVLTGFSVLSGLSHITETISITNATATSLAFHFFQYSDFELGGLSSGDTVQLGKSSLSGKFNEANQSKFGGLFMHETDVAPGADHGEANIFNATLVKLNDASPTTLNDVAGPVTGDATWALEWDITLAPGGSFGISKEKTLQVPEPSILALLSVGIVGSILRRRAKA